MCEKKAAKGHWNISDSTCDIWRCFRFMTGFYKTNRSKSGTGHSMNSSYIINHILQQLETFQRSISSEGQVLSFIFVLFMHGWDLHHHTKTFFFLPQLYSASETKGLQRYIQFWVSYILILIIWNRNYHLFHSHEVHPRTPGLASKICLNQQEAVLCHLNSNDLQASFQLRTVSYF